MRSTSVIALLALLIACGLQFDADEDGAYGSQECNDNNASDAVSWYADADGFGEDAVSKESDQAPLGYLLDAGDCDGLKNDDNEMVDLRRQDIQPNMGFGRISP